MKRKVLAIITTILLLMTLIPTTAFATQYDYDNTYKLKNYSNSGNLIIGGNYSTAVYFNISLNGSSSVITHAFCGDISTSTQPGMLYDVYTLSDAKSRLNDFGNVGKIRSVINKALPGGSISVSNLVAGVKATTGTTINLTKDQAIWATQAAIWYLADNKAFTGVKNASHDSDTHINTMAVYNYLIGLPASSGVNSVTKPTVSIDKSAMTHRLSDDKTRMLFIFPVTTTGSASISYELDTAPSGATISGDLNSAVVSIPVEEFYTDSAIDIDFSASVKGSTYSDAVVYLPVNSSGRLLKNQVLVGFLTIQNKASTKVETTCIDPGSAEFKLYKSSEDTNQPMEGVTFRLVGPKELDPSHVNYKDITAQTDANGYVLFSGLYAGTYELTEPNPISGFVEHKFVIEGNLVSDLNIELPPTYVDDNNNISNRAKPAKIKLLKWSTLTNSVLAGAQFKLYKQDGTEVAGPVTSDTNGIVEFSDLYPGDGTIYVVKEVSTPSGYETADDLVLPTLQRGQALDLTSNSDYRINNDPIPVSIKVLKRDKYYHTPLAGAEFWLYKGALVDGAPQGEPISKKTTSANGTVVFSGLSPKTTYVVKEMVAPQHYSLSTSDENIQVVKIDTPGSQKQLTYNNAPDKGSIKVNKTIDGSPAGSTLDTVSFRLVGPYINASAETPLPGLSPATQEKTLSNGTATFTNLVHGQYRLFEIADSTTSGNYKTMQGYRVVTVGLGAGQVKEDVDNELIKGYLKITKQDADTYAGDPYKNLQGIVFKVYSDEALTNLVDTMTTNASGIAKSKKLNPGTYYVKETSAPNVYEPNDTIYPVEILYSQGQGERITPLTVTNTKKKGNFALRKLSNFDNTIRLSGAEFTFTNQRTGEEHSLITDANGYAELLNLAPGNYLLKETVEPHGYDAMLDMNGDGVDDVDGLVVEVFPGRTTQGEYIVNIYNDPEEATVSVTKFQAGNHNVRLGGVKFALYRGSVTPANKIGASKITDVNGKVGWNNLDPGDYILVEEATIAGYIMPDDPNTEFTLEPGEHQVITIDNKATPGSVKVLKQDKYYKTPLAGAEFWLYEGALVDGQPQGEPIDKKTTGTDGIVVFGDLSLEKTYVIVEVVAPQHYSLADGSGNIQVVSLSTPGAQENLTFRNEPDKGALKVNKTIDGSPAGTTLDTVSFRLVGPYVDASSGTTITGHAPTTVEKTLANGTATFSDLLHGQYRLYELADSAVTNNYNVLQGYKVVTVGLGQALVQEDVDNTVIKGYLEITKKDSDTYPDDPYIDLEGVVFKVYSDEGLTNLADTLTTNALGIAKSKKLPPGTYYVKETSAPSVYQVNDTVYPVVIQYSQGQGERITPLTVTNTKKNGSFALRKLSNYDKTTLLSNAVFKLTSVNNPAVSYTLTTDINGYASRQNIAPGHYRLTEVTAPIGYTAMSDMNGDGVDDPDGLLIDVYPGRTTEEVVVIYNQPEEATVSVTKSQKGNSSVRLEGVQFALYKDSVSSENKIGDSKLTDVNGNVSWSNLVTGSYILVEEATITGYVMPTDPNTEFTLEPGERQVIKIDNTATPGSVKVVKRDAYYKNTLAGAEFWLYKGDLVGGEPQGEAIDKKTTGSDGVVTFEGLTIGATYVVVEKVAPANYTLQPGSGNIQVVTVTTPNGEETLAFHNEPIKGSLRVNKTIDGSPAGNTLDAVSFRLVGPYVDATTGTEITGFAPITEEKALTNGTVTFNNLIHGQYRLYEVADSVTGGNYNVMQNYRVVTVGLGGEVVEEDVDNQIIKGYLEIDKEDANTYLGDTYINLEGIVFEVYSDAALTNVVDTLTTDASGYAKSQQLTPGTYFVKETSAPSVYQENNTVYEVEILWSQGQGEKITNLKVTNVKKTGDFALRKLSYFDKSKALENAVFSLTNINDSSLVYTMTTGNDGYATKLNIVPGKYRLREVTAPVGYMAMVDMDDDGTDDPDGLLVEIHPGRTTTGEDVITVYNQPSRSTAVVAKFQKGDHSIRLQGVRFALYKDSVSTANKIGNSQYTDPNGNIVWNNLVPGKYVLVEETTIAGYILPDNPNTTFTLDGGEHQVVVIENVYITPTPTPTTTYRPRSTPTPVITATPTPIPSGDITIEEEDTPYGPETGEGDMLFIGIGALLLLAIVLLVIRKKLVK